MNLEGMFDALESPSFMATAFWVSVAVVVLAAWAGLAALRRG